MAGWLGGGGGHDPAMPRGGGNYYTLLPINLSEVPRKHHQMSHCLAQQRAMLPIGGLFGLLSYVSICETKTLPFSGYHHRTPVMDFGHSTSPSTCTNGCFGSPNQPPFGTCCWWPDGRWLAKEGPRRKGLRQRQQKEESAPAGKATQHTWLAWPLPWCTMRLRCT